MNYVRTVILLTNTNDKYNIFLLNNIQLASILCIKLQNAIVKLINGVRKLSLCTYGFFCNCFKKNLCVRTNRLNLTTLLMLHSLGPIKNTNPAFIYKTIIRIFLRRHERPLLSFKLFDKVTKIG